MTSRSFFYRGGGGGEETVAQLNLDLLWWNLVEFTAIHSSRHERRVSSAACQGIITDLLQARNVAEALSGLLGLHNVGGLMRLCASPWLRTATLEEEERDQWCCSCLSNVCLVTGSAKHSGGALGRIDYAPQGYLFWDNIDISTGKGPLVTFPCPSKLVHLAPCGRPSCGCRLLKLSH